MNWRFLVGVGLVGGCGKGAPGESTIEHTAFKRSTVHVYD